MGALCQRKKYQHQRETAEFWLLASHHITTHPPTKEKKKRIKKEEVEGTKQTHDVDVPPTCSCQCPHRLRR